MNKQQFRLSLLLELVGWIVTAVILVFVLFPIAKAYKDFPFWTENILFIVTFVTLTRTIFLLKHTFFARIWSIKFILAIACIPFVFFLIGSLYDVQAFLDGNGLYALGDNDLLKEPLAEAEMRSLVEYVRNELFFFGTGSIIAAFIFPFRMIISVWRVRNRGTV